MVRKLQSILDSERENCGSVSEERLKLQQENERLQKETEDLRKLAMEAQQTAKLKVFFLFVLHISDLTKYSLEMNGWFQFPRTLCLPSPHNTVAETVTYILIAKSADN